MNNFATVKFKNFQGRSTFKFKNFQGRRKIFKDDKMFFKHHGHKQF